MRYTKELQDTVSSEVKKGKTPADVAKKYNVPLSVVMKWNNLSFSAERAKVIALRKYQPEIAEAERKTLERLDKYLPGNISDENYLAICSSVSKTSCELVTEIVRQERNLNPHDEPLDCEVIAEITRKWNNNKFIEKYKDLCYL